MFNFLLQIKNYYLKLKKYYFSIVLIEKKYEIGALVTYKRKVQDGQILISGFGNIIESLTKLLDKTEEKLQSDPSKITNIIELKENEIK